ncbi:hypothetical protein M2322_004521 [Rhodoblastus acidophilus]|uniref:hypothetical protein n=1 Tax=Rhodoblastus acidophilus TaxID=1074 RepID=UPI002224061F|nr:hypothetical protein [Rhodoblastus acidophilus]MCW2318952.1 hypothetical protein [Rhodoblastus acidophilus]
MPAKLFDHLSASVAQRLRPILLGAAMRALALGLTALFAAFALGFGALAGYAALSAAEGPIAAAMIVAGLFAGLALTTFLLAARRAAPPQPIQADPLVDAVLAAVGAQDQLARALTQAARVVTPTRLVVLALGCGLVAGARLRKRPIQKA